MHPEDQYAADSEFRKLMARREDADLTVAALELAREFQPGLDIQPTLDWIDARAGELTGPVARASTERDMLEAFCRHLAHEYRLHGDEACYERPEGSFLNCVIETRTGLPISLSAVYMAVAERLDLELHGVSAPVHFLTRYESSTGPLFVDAFHEGRILEPDECVDWLQRISKAKVPQIRRALKPVDTRTIIIRMLNNLKALFARNDQWPQAWKTQHRLVALEPSAYRERRDLALIALRAEQHSEAIELLETCLKTCPPDERDILEAHLNEAKKLVARWN